MHGSVLAFPSTQRRASGGTADAHGSGPCARKGVRVQIPPRPRRPLVVEAPASSPEAFVFSQGDDPLEPPRGPRLVEAPASSPEAFVFSQGDDPLEPPRGPRLVEAPASSPGLSCFPRSCRRRRTVAGVADVRELGTSVPPRVFVPRWMPGGAHPIFFAEALPRGAETLPPGARLAPATRRVAPDTFGNGDLSDGRAGAVRTAGPPVRTRYLRGPAFRSLSGSLHRFRGCPLCAPLPSQALTWYDNPMSHYSGRIVLWSEIALKVPS